MSLGGAEAIDFDDENDDSVSAIVNDALELEQPPCFIGRQFEHGWSLFPHAHDLQRATFPLPLHEQHFFCLTDPDAGIFDGPAAITTLNKDFSFYLGGGGGGGGGANQTEGRQGGVALTNL